MTPRLSAYLPNGRATSIPIHVKAAAADQQAPQFRTSNAFKSRSVERSSTCFQPEEGPYLFDHERRHLIEDAQRRARMRLLALAALKRLVRRFYDEPRAFVEFVEGQNVGGEQMSSIDFKATELILVHTKFFHELR